MRKQLLIVIQIHLLAFIFSFSYGQNSACQPCGKIQELKLPDIVIHTATQINIGDNLDGKGPSKSAYCKVLGVIGKEINFELLLPNDFNGRFAMSGGGGFVSGISNSLRGLTNEGYVTAGTDVGHKKADPSIWAEDNMERQLNFGHLAIHRTAVTCKNLLEQYYCQPPAYSYFVGTSRGGGQAMMEAQRYPEDFDGIVAGAPAFNWTGFASKFVQITQQFYPNGLKGGSLLSSNHLKLLQAKILEQCDQLDGVKDVILNDPRTCLFDFTRLPVCPSDKQDSTCFTSQQIEAIKAVYQPLIIEGKQMHAGFPLGGEGEVAGWDPWMMAAKPPTSNYPSFHAYFGIETFKYLILNDKNWDYQTYRFDQLYKDIRYASAYLNATSTDYSAFKKRGGKMLIWQGWADPAISALDIMQHYDQAKIEDPQLDEYIRMYLLPGVLHGGGQGPDKVKWLHVLQNWVEKGIVPNKIVASKTMNGVTVITRPIYPYPAKVKYKGKGDPTKEENFELD